MSKPSIFSKDYDRKMKNRKRLQIITIIVLVIGILVMLTRAYVQNWLKVNADKLTNNQKQYVNDTNTNTKKTKSDETQKDAENKKEEEQKPTENKSTINVKFPDGKTVKVDCIDNGETKKISSVVSGGSDKISFNISKSADEAVILDDKQNMYVVDLTGKVTAITKDKYISTRGSVIVKDSYLSMKPNFIWHSNPRFISDGKVAYVTQMPWFRTTQYVYTVDIKTNSHVRIPMVQGNKITFGKLTKKGLEMTVDGNEEYISSKGTIVK
ncbi:hypothetical protein [Clostridium oryzae]|uniref:Uncharacterized protein n=1 Tax=Clostridium oryzae TaxID=1450648 RepID=A0A1V4IJW2_9CLOT|nr:hypothetical protein [Clostridium oryzae]OPJ60301.1 hypothetical protein CLORY_28760 [Clostridium oryzae]